MRIVESVLKNTIIGIFPLLLLLLLVRCYYFFLLFLFRSNSSVARNYRKLDTIIILLF